MDSQNYTIVSSDRKKGQHLRIADRGAIQVLNRLGYSNRAIAKTIGCSPSTVSNELKRGQDIYETNRSHSRKPLKINVCQTFIAWAVRQIREHKWSLDACCGYARLHRLFSSDEMVCTRTLYHMVWKGHLSIIPIELPAALKRKTKVRKEKTNKKQYGNSISNRPEIARLRLEEGHWEGDTVLGRRAGKDSVILSLLEKKTQNYIAVRIPGKTSEAVMEAMSAIHDSLGEHFSKVFKTITVDNGSEFSDLGNISIWGTQVYFAHPYSSWERAQNERHNGLFRAFIPKGVSIDSYTDDEILSAADELNGRPRKKLGYHTPEELFDAFLDAVFVA